ncbi:hypothetical protein CANMA_000196 [Candida margitis]|uniref:uncharacterized protein n=1 Tax=Candida margitis TaxID=1775924 RepID=UPI0022278DA0|nr:uncharacterized protein CANMA_000196 [Candida margitis]KAI5970777.1 hypothetical protein CANMA_000196 [Candida margitis]
MTHIIYLIVIASFVIYKLLHNFQLRQRSKKLGCKPIKKIPARNWLDYFGLDDIVHHKELTEKGQTFERIEQAFERANAKTFQGTAVFKSFIMTIEPENLRHMMSSAHFNEWNIGHRPKAFGILLGDGIFSSEGTQWKHSRVMLRPSFTKENIKQITKMEPFAARVIELVKSKHGASIDMQDVFQFFTMDFTTDLLLGESSDSLKDALGQPSRTGIDPELKKQFSVAFDVTSDYLMVRMILGSLMFLVNPKRLQDAIKTQHKFVDYYIEKALAMNNEELDEKSDDGTIFLYQLARETKDPINLRNQILSIILAGRNTTSALMTFLFAQLSKRPELYSKLRDIIRQDFPDVESITFDSIQNCDYLRWCINETLRYNPSVPFESKTASVDTTLPRGGGNDEKSPIYVRKNTRILYSLWVSNRNEEYFGKETDKFIPERWEHLPRNGGIAFMPFSVGPRACLGQSLALTEAAYMTIRLLQTFDSCESHLGPEPLRKTSSATMRLMDGCEVSFK